MTGPPTTKHGLPTLAGGEDINDFPPVFNETVDTLDDLIATAIDDMPRPAAGTFGRFHRNPLTGGLSFDTGIGWLELSSADAAAAGATFVGMMVVDAGTGDISTTNQEWMRPDGRLINRTVYSTYFARVGHTHNNGVDPGGGLVRLPDYRGRTIVGTDDMGTGAASRLTGYRARGQNSGEEFHRLTIAEMPSHDHAQNGAGSSVQVPNGSFYGVATDAGSRTGLTGGGQPHYNMPPYAVDNLLVRVR